MNSQLHFSVSGGDMIFITRPKIGALVCARDKCKNGQNERYYWQLQKPDLRCISPKVSIEIPLMCHLKHDSKQ
jgi:hypothetical protein